MRKMNRKIFIVLFSLFISFGFAVNITALENETSGSDADNYNENNIVYPTMTDMPPRSPEILKIMDPDPQPTMNVDDLPSQFNWCNYDGGDWSSPAKDQASCGSCWDFSALGGLEAAINIASGRPDLDIDLSEQYVLSCLGAAGSCSGGWMSEALQYIQSTDPGNTGNSINGVTIESCMPYTATDSVPCNDKCSDWDYITDPPQPDNKLWEIESWGVTSISEDSQSGWDLIKTWLITHGPVITDIYVGGWGSFWSNNNDPNDVYEQDDSGITNHGVLICGWVDDTTVVNGGYWIIKNSWGQGWGYNGFGNIAYGCNSVGTRDLSWVEAPD